MMRLTTSAMLLLLGSTAQAKDHTSFLHRMLEDYEQGDEGGGGGDDDFFPMDGPPCYPCGPNGFTTTPDQLLPIPDPIDDGELNCAEAYDLFVGGAVSDEEECEFASMFFNELCGCASAPTISPAPTTSFRPSSSPTTTPLPTVSVCYLCGTEEAGANVSWDSSVTIPGLFDEFPCGFLNEILPDYGVEGFAYESDVSCVDIQAYGKECGCLPLEPTISPAPTSSVKPSTTPTTSPFPTAAPCYLCGGDEWVDLFNYDDGDENVYISGGDDAVDKGDNSDNGNTTSYYYGGGKVVTLPGFGNIDCPSLQDIALFSGFPPEIGCVDIQAFGKECGCPPTEPTVSPAPTVSREPTRSPTVSPAPTAPCSCEGFCNSNNPRCGCWCDSVCESLGDCCGDVSDYCVFEDRDEEGPASMLEEDESFEEEKENESEKELP